ncbi:hypothetical protein KKC74_05720 [bacterium]|nr:hypothetical protein [bacterium]MBU1064289.1 hypothetical protein [bacterium]MBU1873422.1 hypothetical protein [bacterium]
MTTKRIKNVNFFFNIGILFLFHTINGKTIHVPTDSLTIQSGIDGSFDGDTVLVEPGIYYENINFKGKNIILTSIFILTADTFDISHTIIDGDSSGSVVTFENMEDSTTILNGFIIRNGYNSDGGGIKCNNSNPILKIY